MIFQGSLFLLGFLCAIFLLEYLIYLYRNKKIEFIPFLSWIIIAIGLMIVALFPGLIEWIIQALRLNARGFFIITLSVLVLYFLMIQISARQSQLEIKIKKLNQEISLLEYIIEYNEVKK